MWRCIALLLLLSTASAAKTFTQTGSAVYYSGRKDGSTPYTAAHRTLPLGTWVEVTHRRTARTIMVKINDRGPFGHTNRIIDMSYAAAKALGILREGVAPVRLRVVKSVSQ